MLKRLGLALLLVCLLPVCLSAREKRFGYCQISATGARVTNCTVTVYLAGTLTLAPQIYQDNLGTPKSSIFTADPTTGLWFFYADNGHYDVNFSGGSPTISPPYTLSDFLFLDLGIQPIQALSLQSASANPAQSGFIEMAAIDSICWRNRENTGDLCVAENVSDQLTFNSNTFAFASAANAFTSTNTFSSLASFVNINNTVKCDQEPGADVSLKIKQCLADAIAKNLVADAIGFTGAQVGSVDPFVGVTSSVTLLFPATTISTPVMWNPQNDGVQIIGVSPKTSVLAYTGTSNVAAVMEIATATPITNWVQSAKIENMQFKGNSHVTDGLLLMGVHRSTMRNLQARDVTGCGFHEQFDVIVDWDQPQVTNQDIPYLVQPTNGMCLDKINNSNFSTASTITNPIMESVSGDGIVCTKCTTMHFVAGTSENNGGRAITFDANSSYNKVDGLDMESNSGAEDVLDNGFQNEFSRVLSTKKIHFSSTSTRGLLSGGSVNAVQIDSGATRIRLCGFDFDNQGTAVLSDSGTATQYECGLVDLGAGAYNTPWWGNIMPARIPGAGLPAGDPQEIQHSQWYITTTASDISRNALTIGQSWAIWLRANWIDNFDGVGSIPLGTLYEATSSNPTITVGTAVVTFSVSGTTGHLQAQITGGSATTASFAGMLEVYSSGPNPSYGTNTSLAASLAGDVAISNLRLGSSGVIKNQAGTATMGLTLKKGSGAGNYTSASTTYAVVDSTNLCNTVTIPVGWKLSISMSGAIGTATGAVAANLALTDNAACSTANSGLLVETAETTTAAGVLQPVSLNWVISGDGASHSIAIQYKTSNGSDSVTLLNASSTQLPTMVFSLSPSN